MPGPSTDDKQTRGRYAQIWNCSQCRNCTNPIRLSDWSKVDRMLQFVKCIILMPLLPLLQKATRNTEIKARAGKGQAISFRKPWSVKLKSRETKILKAFLKEGKHYGPVCAFMTFWQGCWAHDGEEDPNLWLAKLRKTTHFLDQGLWLRNRLYHIQKRSRSRSRSTKVYLSLHQVVFEMTFTH